MKVLLINKFFYPKGGAEVSFFETSRLLKEKGNEVIYFSMQDPANLSTPWQKYFVSNINFESKSLIEKLKAIERILYSSEAKRKIEQLIKDTNPDIVHLNNIYHQISPSILHIIKSYNLPVVMHLRDYKLICPNYLLFNKGKICEKCKNGKYYYCLINKCVKDSFFASALNTFEAYLHNHLLHIYDLVDIFISPSKFLKDKFEQFGFRKNIVYLPNFVNLQEYRPYFGYQKNCFVYFGRLSWEKGIWTLLKAVKGLEVNLKIIGDGPLKPKLKEFLKKEKINNVEILGYKTGAELTAEIKKGMGVIVPSQWYENNPRNVLESFSLGKPVIGARIGGIPELVKDWETGLTFEPGNFLDLRQKICEFLEKQDKVLEMGKNARNLIEKEFNSEKWYNGIMSIYNQAIIKSQRSKFKSKNYNSKFKI